MWEKCGRKVTKRWGVTETKGTKREENVAGGINEGEWDERLVRAAESRQARMIFERGNKAKRRMRRFGKRGKKKEAEMRSWNKTIEDIAGEWEGKKENVALMDWLFEWPPPPPPPTGSTERRSTAASSPLIPAASTSHNPETQVAWRAVAGHASANYPSETWRESLSCIPVSHTHTHRGEINPLQSSLVVDFPMNQEDF